MKTKLPVISLLATMALLTIFAIREARKVPEQTLPPSVAAAPPTVSDPRLPTTLPSKKTPDGSKTPLAARRNVGGAVLESPGESTNRLERLTQIRENFRVLAAGDPTTALRAAKQIADETERETALQTLIMEWTHGEIGPARTRARVIGELGIEAGWGAELATNPELATLWANELSDGAGRTAILQRVALALADSDPGAALAVGAQLPPAEHARFIEGVYSTWATGDTSAAIQSAEQITDPAERDAAMQAIRTVAPVGIGAALSMQDGYPTINGLMPGTPADLSGQLHPGDRILALAQGNNQFVDARGFSLADTVQMIRGAPNTILQLQILPAGAPPNSPPQTVSIIRDQIKFKR